jgi:DNA primase
MTWTLPNGEQPDIEVVISDRLGPPTHSNGSISYLCPFHDDHNPSLSIQPEFNRFPWDLPHV